MRSAIRPALAVLLLVGVGIAGVDLPDRPGRDGPPCDRCCDAADQPDPGAALGPALVPEGMCVAVAHHGPVQVLLDPEPATPDRAADVLVAAPKTSPPSMTA